jgi:hypothetical protein
MCLPELSLTTDFSSATVSESFNELAVKFLQAPWPRRRLRPRSA